jgi:hypothetical protein
MKAEPRRELPMSLLAEATCILALSLYVAYIFFPSHAAEKRAASPTMMEWQEVSDKLCQSMIGPSLMCVSFQATASSLEKL